MALSDRAIIVDQARLQMTPWNQAYGNKLLHLLYVISLCERHDRELVVPCDSNLDEIIDVSRFKTDSPPQDIPYALTESSAFSAPKSFWLRKARRLRFALQKSEEQFREDASFLDGPLPKHPFSVAGHYWHYDLLPSQAVAEEYLTVDADLIKRVLNKYPDIKNDSAVAVHLRETDFRTHLRDYFQHSVMLDDAYYQRSRAIALEKFGRDVTFHLLSDNPERLRSIFEGRNCIVHDGTAPEDWVALYLASNVIQSNSSFCWTACLFNKRFSIQPDGGYNYHLSEMGSIPYGFKMPFSHSVTSKGEHVPPVPSEQTT